MRTHPAFVRLLHVLALILLSGLFILGTGCVHNNDPWYDDPPPPRHHRQPPPSRTRPAHTTHRYRENLWQDKDISCHDASLQKFFFAA